MNFQNSSFVLVFLSVATLCFLINETSAATDSTLVERAIGEDVVDAAIDKISRSGVFKTDDYGFFKRVAYVASLFGVMSDSFPGGLWRSNERRYDLTKASNLSSYHRSIESAFKIQWNDTNFNDLLKPLYSGLAIRLFFTHIEAFEPIPQTLKGQAAYWNKHWNDEDVFNETHFIEEVTQFENSTRCNGKMDLLVVLDESGSIGQPEYTKALEFCGNLFGSYSLETVRQGFMTFSTNVRQQFPIENNLTAAQIQDRVKQTSYAAQNTHTSKALRAAAVLFNQTSVRSGVPRIMALFTDGESNDGSGVGNAALLKAIDVISFAIGIGNYNVPELNEIAYGDQSHVFTLNDFDALQEFFGHLNAETCSIPQTPALEETTTDSLSKNEKRIYRFEVPVEGLTIVLDTSEGQTRGFYSYSYPKPSAAFNDGILNEGETYIPSILNLNFPRDRAGKDNDPTASVFITIQGLEDKNYYTIRASKYLVPTTTEHWTTVEAPEDKTLGNACGGILEGDSGTFSTSLASTSELRQPCLWLIKTLRNSRILFSAESLDGSSAFHLYPEHNPSDTFLQPIILTASNLSSTVETQGPFLLVILVQGENRNASGPFSFSWDSDSDVDSKDGVAGTFYSGSYIDSPQGHFIRNKLDYPQRNVFAWNLESGKSRRIRFDGEVTLGKCDQINPCECSYFGLYEVLPSGYLSEVHRICGRHLSFNVDDLSTSLVQFVYISRQPENADANGSNSVDVRWSVEH